MAENLNIGTQVLPSGNQTNDGIIEKYCHGEVNSSNTEGDCSVWGGLYQWDEMMQYVTTEVNQVICPNGWHIPTDAEWTTMEEALGMCNGVGVGCSGANDWRGTDQGDQLKTATDCFGGVNCGISGFEAFLAGSSCCSVFYNSGTYTLFWSSMKSGTYAGLRYMNVSEARVNRGGSDKLNGYSVRCIKD